MVNDEVEQLFDWLEENTLLDIYALEVIANAFGYSVETYETVLYAATGWRSLTQARSEYEEEEELIRQGEAFVSEATWDELLSEALKVK